MSTLHCCQSKTLSQPMELVGCPTYRRSFRGPAPLQHTLLAGCTETGVTLQTLHLKRFDHGRILAQTPPFSVETVFRDSSGVPGLMELVAPKGAELLIEGIRKGLFVPNKENPDIIQNNQATRSVRPAPKITPEDRHINWNTWSADEIIRKHQIIGPLWNIASSFVDGKITKMRIIWVSGFSRSPTASQLSLRAGKPFVEQPPDSDILALAVRTRGGTFLRIDKAKIEGSSTKDAFLAVRQAGMLRDNSVFFTLE